MSDFAPGFDIRPGHEYRRERLASEYDRLMRRRQWALLRGDMDTLPNLDRQLESMAGELKKPGKARARELVKAGVRRERVIQAYLKNKWPRRTPTVYRYNHNRYR